MAATYTITAPYDVALTPPTGITPDFQDPYTLKPFHTMTASAALALTTAFVLARMYTKVAIMESVKWEDCELCLPIPALLRKAGLIWL